MAISNELSEAIVLYIGLGRSIAPKMDRTRLVEAYGEARAGELEPALASMIAEADSIEIDWSAHTLQSAAASIASRLQAKHPELSGRALEALAWKFSYDWR